jgi:uncharacterized alpha-E superfamily protein
LVLSFPVNVHGDVTRMWMILPMLSDSHFFVSLLASSNNDVDGVVSLVGFNHSTPLTLLHQASRLHEALTVLANPEGNQQMWERLTLLAERQQEAPRLEVAMRFSQSRVVNILVTLLSPGFSPIVLTCRVVFLRSSPGKCQ